MTLYSDPPPLRAFSADKPTLLVCWWMTMFCVVLILLRVCGRFVRTETLFSEDKTAALALVPLLLRMGCVHFILVNGTNNADFSSVRLSEEQMNRKAVASGLVLLSRVLYALTLWILKYAILQFFKRLNVSWERSYELTLSFIKVTLVTTFIAVIVSDVVECRPFRMYSQVLPDPGGQCRQGYVQLLTMAICNIVTDLLLVFFPIPMIIRSQMSLTRKFQLVLLFSLSLGVVGVTVYRVPHIIRAQGSQQSRSLYASIELLFATAASNALVLGSFVRDRGVKKRKYKYSSIAAGSLERSPGSGPGGAAPNGGRRPTLRHWGSDEDLVRDVGYGVKPDLRERLIPYSDEIGSGGGYYTPAPMAQIHHHHHDNNDTIHSWDFPPSSSSQARSTARSDDYLMSFSGHSSQPGSPRNTTPNGLPTLSSPRRVSFFDYGGLLSDEPTRGRRESSVSTTTVEPPRPHTVPVPAVPASASGLRRGSAALLQDLGGFLSPWTLSAVPKSARRRSWSKGRGRGGGGGRPKSTSDLESIPQMQGEEHEHEHDDDDELPTYSSEEERRRLRLLGHQEGQGQGQGHDLELVDAGGLLKEPPVEGPPKRSTTQ
ncbi:hypothetical protein NEUTE1DRAFT_145770 [Neurospora tetrasperma FGSC 2508]|uniref:Rhodopsin domain-containing protein n=1 Tax=Neurospora tetrasperma (strain FGSC 2508 / ATCC MYA-4615 / P0657) TaxID=510951 RepID=F8MIY1_NEUT8|nr:uncharacterized protein NEUTE1DRAFT_145770 [Neurospora tetrasperma FGSC 2508]EGO59878.1 hypothetical protein NEUTE1DRAFT_145770 [Neurospora tetrasperma FGSC 2508]EGZ74027.1 hypothetical protein NEUTE2DRAFT_109191 [Neurospora tetrasperma FGSC 2509]